MVSVGYNSDEIEKIISETKFNKFNDGNYPVHRINTHYRWYRHNKFNEWLEKIISDKTGNSDIYF